MSDAMEFTTKKTGLGLDCDFCFNDTQIVIFPPEKRATDLRLCADHARELGELLSIHFPANTDG